MTARDALIAHQTASKDYGVAIAGVMGLSLDADLTEIDRQYLLLVAADCEAQAKAFRFLAANGGRRAA